MGQGKKIGYKRVSTNEQNPDSQLIGIELDRIFVDIETGYSTKNRHGLANLKEYVRDDDVVFVECMDRLGRNGYDLDAIVEFLLKKGVQVNFVRESIILGKKNDIMSKLAYDMMKSFIHFFSQLAKERQRIGIEKAKKEGKYKGGKTKLTFLMQCRLKELMKTRTSKSKISKELGISRFTLYRYLEKIQQQQQQEHEKDRTI
jgi:DNA invertase Pin-like site-specific DNA recombinase